MNELIAKTFNDQKVLTTKQLAECYETEPKVISQNFIRNNSHYSIGVHCFLIAPSHEAYPQFADSHFQSQPIYLWTEKGCLLHAKSLGTDKAWQVYEMLVDTYFRVKELIQPKSIEDLIIMQAQSVKELKSQVAQLVDKQSTQQEQLQTIKDTIVSRDENWRKWVDDSIKKIGFARGNYSACYAEARNESYEMLKDRGHCNIETQLSHLKERLKEAGATQTKINLANKIDVIESDPKLKEIYTGIIKEMFIKYVA